METFFTSVWFSILTWSKKWNTYLPPLFGICAQSDFRTNYGKKLVLEQILFEERFASKLTFDGKKQTGKNWNFRFQFGGKSDTKIRFRKNQKIRLLKKESKKGLSNSVILFKFANFGCWNINCNYKQFWILGDSYFRNKHRSKKFSTQIFFHERISLNWKFDLGYQTSSNWSFFANIEM